jgi:hypothetical protein
VLGLAIGISASLVIYLLVKYDLGFDKFHADSERIYRVVCKFDFSGEIFYNSGVAYPLAKAVKEEVSGIEEVVPVNLWDGQTEVSVTQQPSGKPKLFTKQRNIVFVNEHYFDLISYKWLAGTPETSLQQPYGVVLTESNANLYFPGLSAANVIGKEIIFADTVRATITGVVENLKGNTDFTFLTFISRATQESTSLQPADFTNWETTTSASQLLIKLSAGTKPAQIEKQLAALYKKYTPNTDGKENKSPFLLQPLHQMHLDANYGTWFDNRVANEPTLYGLLIIAAFLMLLGCINFINLTTAQASKRAKEIGIRKTMGSTKAQLIFQFLGETFLLTFIATLLSIVFIPFLLQVFRGFIPDGLQFNLIQQPGLILFLLAFTIAVSLLAGFYPALLLSGYKPVLALKNQAFSSGSSRKLWLRKTLTVSQFVIAQVFIIGSLIVTKQINYTLSKDLGFKKDAIIYFETNFFDTVQTRKAALLSKLQAIPGIGKISLSNNPVAATGTWSSSMKYKDGKKEVETNVQMKMGDTNYVSVYNLNLLAGTNLKQTDSIQEFIINESYAHVLGFQKAQDAIGNYLEWDERPVPIVGVVKDFHQQSLHAPIKPLAIGSWPLRQKTFNIALSSQDKEGWKTTIGKIEKAFKEVYAEDDFEYSFQDETIARYYESEQRISRLLKWATGLTVFISCLGLLGLVIYTTSQRTKEIGVRKVLGASVAQIVSLLSKDFIVLVLLAFVIAAPLALVGVHKWLQNFSYRTDVSWWIFLLAGGIMTLIALLTLSFQTIKSAMMNPVRSLRTE